MHLLLLALPLLAAAASFDAHWSATTTPWRPVLTQCFGSGHASLTLRADWREALLRVKQDIGPTYVIDGNYGFANIFNTFDYLVSIDMKPIVELSFMPEELASGTTTVMHYKGNVTPPSSLDAWGDLIFALINALVGRYGLDEVNTWKFEVWNEPDGKGFWDATQAQYFALYNTTSHAVKRAAPSLTVGGPATSQLNWIPDFLNYTATVGAPADIVTSHLYPTDPELNQTRSSWLDYVTKSAAVVAASGKRFIMTEFNAGLGDISKVRDTPYSAAMVVSTAIGLQPVDVLDIASFWTFSDVFEEGGFPVAPYDVGGQYGIQTYNGIPKSSYRAFEMLAGVLPDVLAISNDGNVDMVVSTDGTNIFALATNYNFYGQPIANETVTLTVTGLTCKPPATATVQVIDETHGNAHAVWVAQGSPDYGTPAQLAAQLAGSKLTPVTAPIDSSVSGQAVVKVSLSAYATASISFPACQ